MGAIKINDSLCRLLDEKQAAEYIGMSLSFLQQSRSCGAKLESRRKAANSIPGPLFKKIGTLVRYDISDLDSWVESFASVRTLAELAVSNLSGGTHTEPDQE